MSGPGQIPAGGRTQDGQPRGLLDVRNTEEQPGLVVDGQRWVGWERLSWERSLDDLVGLVQFEARLARPWGVRLDADVQLVVGSEVLLTGRVDQLAVSVGEGGAKIAGAARDRVAALVDSSAQHSPPEWYVLTVLELARELCVPFGIAVEADVPVGDPIDLHRLELGETPWACLERALRLRGLLGVSDGRGGLRLTRPGQRAAQVRLDYSQAVSEDRGIKAAVLSLDSSDRYQTYLVRGQDALWDVGPAGEDDEVEADLAGFQIEGRATDPGARPGRTLILPAQGPITQEDADRAAAWEATVRAARTHSLQVQLAGWRQARNGPVWEPGLSVQVSIPPLDVQGEMIVRAVRSTLDRSGTQTTLQLSRPDAYAPGVLPPEKAAGRLWLVEGPDGELVPPSALEGGP